MFRRHTGTQINRLPILFCEAYQSYLDTHHKGKKAALFDMRRKDPLSLREETEEYATDCKAVMDLYEKYQRLAEEIRLEKNKGSHGRENMEKLIARIYDPQNEADIHAKVLPNLMEKMDTAIPQDAAMRDIMDRLNTCKWQFQPYDKRGDTLEKIIGNGFCADDLDEEEKALLFHFDQHGYKLLWHLLATVEEGRIRPYEKIKTDLEKEDDAQDPLPKLALISENRCRSSSASRR